MPCLPKHQTTRKPDALAPEFAQARCVESKGRGGVARETAGRGDGPNKSTRTGAHAGEEGRGGRGAGGLVVVAGVAAFVGLGAQALCTWRTVPVSSCPRTGALRVTHSPSVCWPRRTGALRVTHDQGTVQRGHGDFASRAI